MTLGVKLGRAVGSGDVFQNKMFVNIGKVQPLEGGGAEPKVWKAEQGCAVRRKHKGGVQPSLAACATEMGLFSPSNTHPQCTFSWTGTKH